MIRRISSLAQRCGESRLERHARLVANGIYAEGREMVVEVHKDEDSMTEEIRLENFLREVKKSEDVIRGTTSLEADYRGVGEGELSKIVGGEERIKEIGVKRVLEIIAVDNDCFYPRSGFQAIVNSAEKWCFTNVWRYLSENLTEMDISQINSMLKSMRNMIKNYNKEVIEPIILKRVVENAKTLIPKCSALDLSCFLNELKFLDGNKNISIKYFENSLLSVIRFPNTYNHSESLSIFLSLPSNAAELFPVLTKQLSDSVINSLSLYDSLALLELIKKFDEISVPIPFSLIIRAENFDFPQTSDYITAFKILARNQQLSVEFFQKSSILISGRHPGIKLTLEAALDLAYYLYKQNSMSVVLSCRLFNRFLVSDIPNMELEPLLKLCIIYSPHLIQFSILDHCTEKLKIIDQSSLLITNEKTELLKELQQVIIENYKEKPIFQYQFNSFKVFENLQVIELAGIINRLLKKVIPNDKIVLEFYNSHICKEMPGKEIVSTVPEDGVMRSWAEIIWRHKELFSDCKHAVRQAIEIFERNQLKCMETLYYLTSIDRGCRIEKKVIANSDYQYALCYNLECLPLNEDKISNLIDFSSMKTESIIKTIIILQRIHQYDLIKSATDWLNFTESNHPAIDVSLIEELVDSLVKPIYINEYTTSMLISKYFSELSENTQEKVWWLFEGYGDNIFVNLKIDIDQAMAHKSLSKLKSKYVSCFFQDLHNDNIAITADLLKTMSVHKIFSTKIIDQAILKLNSSNCPEMLSSLLSLISSTSGNSLYSKKLFTYISTNNLAQMLCFEDELNYQFLQHLHSNSSLVSKYSPIPYNLEELLTDSALNLQYFPSFKYKTLLEPRQICTNNLSSRSEISALPISDELPTNELLVNAKIYSIFQDNPVLDSSNLKSLVKMLFEKSRRTDEFRRFQQDFLKFAKNYIQKYQNQHITISTEIIDDSGWLIDFCIEEQKLIVLVNTEDDFYWNETEKRLTILSKIIHSRIKSSRSNYHVVSLEKTNWDTLNPSEKLNFFECLKISKTP